MKNIALFYANWEKFGEPWSTPLGVKWELESRGIAVGQYNLYHDDGNMLPGKGLRTYSGDCFNVFNQDYHNGYRPDALVVMDYGPFDYVGMDKKYFPDVPFILEAGDTPQSFRIHAGKARKFDAIVTPDSPSADMFNHLGIRAEWMTHWADHAVFHPNYEVEAVYDCVSTCGGRKVTADIQKELGDRFNNERYFFGEDHAKRLMMGKMVFQCSQFKEITRRVFEGMAVGRMVITDRLPPETRIQELFIDGEDIVYYDNAQDAIDKIKYYAEHTEERERIARNGFIKVLQNHTVGNRVDQLIQLVGKLKNDFIISPS
jgi:hypothetical protein